MLFKKYRSVPANTLLTNPDSQKLSIGKGEIIQWMILFPVEAANLLQIRVEYHNTQIMPFSGSEWIYGGGFLFAIPDSIKIDDGPYVLDIYAINTDTAKAHEYDLYVNVKPAKPVAVGEEIEGLWERLKGWIGGE